MKRFMFLLLGIFLCSFSLVFIFLYLSMNYVDFAYKFYLMLEMLVCFIIGVVTIYLCIKK